jgi:thymidine kinase
MGYEEKIEALIKEHKIDINNRKIGKLVFFFGTMKSGKTALLIDKYLSQKLRGHKVWCIKPVTDVRNGDEIFSRVVKLKDPVIVDMLIKTDEDLSKIPDDLFLLLVDESQFLTESQVERLRKIANNTNVMIFCFGLKTDSSSKSFPGSRRLFELCDKIVECATSCWFCNRKAIHSMRVIDGVPSFGGDQFAIENEGNIDYFPVCAACWDKFELESKENEAKAN